MRLLRFLLVFVLLTTARLLLPRLIRPRSQRPGFSIDNIDKTLDPCVDFYQYACGNWLKKAEIPADQSAWVSFVELDERNLVTLQEILEKASANDPSRKSDRPEDRRFLQLLHGRKDGGREGTGFAQAGARPDRGGERQGTLIDAVARVHLMGPNPLFNFYSSSDLHNADQVIAYIDQGGLSLPDRDYYIKDDARMTEMRKHLVEYVTQMFTLAGQSSTASGGVGANRVAHRDRAGQGFHGPHRRAAIPRLAITR